MSFLLDADTCSAYVRGNQLVQRRFLQYTGQLYLATVTLAELLTWLRRKRTPTKYRQAMATLRAEVRLVELEETTAEKSGELGASLMDRGLRMSVPDLLLAATAQVQGFTVVTHNTQDFIHVPGLSVLDWMVP